MVRDMVILVCGSGDGCGRGDEYGRGGVGGGGDGQGRSGGVEYENGACEDVGLWCGKECCGWDGKGR